MWGENNLSLPRFLLFLCNMQEVIQLQLKRKSGVFPKKFTLTKQIFSIIALLILSFVIIQFGQHEPQDILLKTNSMDGRIIIDDFYIGKNAVCLPNTKTGQHTVKVLVGDSEIVEQVIKVGDTRLEIVKEQKTDKDANLAVNLADCKNW